jgi:predicted enzyme related to lactoylglutathione lyase
MPQPVVHFEISAKNQTKISDFYSQLFGWQVSADNPMNYGLANTKDGELGIDGGIYQQQDAADAPGIRIYAQVDDAAAYLAKAQELGGSLVQPAMETPGMGIMVGMFQDPEGNRFGVVQPLHDHG